MIEEEGARRARLEELKNKGIDPYPTSGERTHSSREFIAAFQDLLKSDEPVKVLGRMLAIRKHGGMTFIVLEDDSDRIQVALKKDIVGEEFYKEFHELFDRGDFVQVNGVAYLTKTEEPTVLVNELTLLTKSLLPLPEKWHGLSDVEIRFRKRYLDLAANPDVRANFVLRARVIKAIRDFMTEQNFMEVETPILQPIAGGAEAKPFETHHNALNQSMYLRIAPELYLKRLLVGGFERVFEIARCFRNEGISFQHNPEFTQIEAYLAYADINQLLEHIEGLLTEIVKAATGGETIVDHRGDKLDFSIPLARFQFYDLVEKETGINLTKTPNEDSLKELMEKKKIDTNGKVGYGELVDEIWKRHVRPKIVQPAFVLGYPAAMKPLAKRDPKNPNKSRNVQLLVKGMELMNAFSELNDPLEQEQRFFEQQILRERGSEEAHVPDYDYIEALKVGMPPAAGYGIGIDRLMTLLTDTHNIKEVILFPTLKRED